MKKLFAILAVLIILILAAIGARQLYINRFPVRGVDVSHYQGEIDFEKLSEQGMQFAFIKATEGSTYVDECLGQNMQRIQETDMRPGYYHFFSFDSPGSTQAENFIANVPAQEGMLPPVIDFEYYGKYFTDPPRFEDVMPELWTMVRALEEHYG